MLLEEISKKLKSNYNSEKSAYSNTETETAPIATALAENEERLRNRFNNSGDFVLRHFTFHGVGGKREQAFVAFADGLIKLEMLSESVIKPMMHGDEVVIMKATDKMSKMEAVDAMLLSAADAKVSDDFEAGISAILNGDCVLFVEGADELSIISCKGYDRRGVEQPTYDVSMRGPRESFNETLRTNTSLLRRRIKNANLVFENVILGRKSNTNICITYIKGLAEPKLIKEIKRRLKYVDTDMILESGYIEQFIEDSPFSVFATIGLTERPDVLAAKLGEGRVGIMIDGSPFVLTAPYLFVEAFQNPEDYYSRTIYSTIVRFFRYLAFSITILLPGIYLALTSFHQELIPPLLLFNMAAAGEGVPFSSFMEITIFLLIYELLKEAGIHMPKNIGQTISIVGGLVMGEAAIRAGIIGAPVVILISFTAVSGFVVPTIGNEVSLLRWIFLFLGGLMGGFGIVLGLIGLTIHVTGLQSFGYSYFSPLMPCRPDDLKDAFVRAPLWLMKKRPYAMANQDKVRNNTPVPPDREEIDE